MVKQKKVNSSKGKQGPDQHHICIKELFLAGLSYNFDQYLPNSVNIVDSMVSSSFEKLPPTVISHT